MVDLVIRCNGLTEVGLLSIIDRINKIIRKGNLYLILDFDDTVTETGHNQWKAFDALMPEAVSKQAEELRNYYISLSNQGLLTPTMEEKWLIRSIERYINRLTFEQFQQVAKNMTMRPGIKRLISAVGKDHFCIITYGMANFAEEVLRLNGITGIQIHGMRIKFTEGMLAGYDPDNLVIGSNKVDFACRYKQSKDSDARFLVLGDSFHDISMMECDSFNFLITDQKIDQSRVTTLHGIIPPHDFDSFVEKILYSVE